jgi:cytochrome c5
MKIKLLSLVFSIGLMLVACKTAQQPITETVKATVVNDGKDATTGLYLDENLKFVQAHCTGCHSAKLITMNRFTRDGWKEKIVWMQQTQKLWDLGEAEPKVLDYLAKYYAPEERQLRRQPLGVKEWYELK